MQEGASGARADDVALAVVLKCGPETICDHARADLALMYSAEGGNRLRPTALNPVATADQYLRPAIQRGKQVTSFVDSICDERLHRADRVGRSTTTKFLSWCARCPGSKRLSWKNSKTNIASLRTRSVRRRGN